MTQHTKGTPAFFDLVLDANNLREDAMRLFAEIRPAWKKDDLDIKTYSEGYINCLMCFRLRSDEAYEDAIVLRVYGGLRETMKQVISSDRELCVMQLAQHAGCFQPILAVFSNGVAYQRAKGRTLTAADFLDPEMIRRISRKLVAFHHFDVTSVPLINHKGAPFEFKMNDGLDPADRQKNVLSMIPEALPDPEKDGRYQEARMKKQEVMVEVKAMKDTIDGLGMDMTLCHGDFHMKNMVYDEETGNIVFLDFEGSDVKQESSDLVKLFGFRPVLEKIGMVKPEEPEITPEVRLEWIRCYLEAKYTHFGKDPADIPKVLVEFSDVEHAVLEAYQYLNFTLMFHVFSGLEKPLFDLDPIEQIPIFKARWVEKKQEIPDLLARYKQLKEDCAELGLL